MRSHLNGFRGPQSALKRALTDLNNNLAESPEWRLPRGSQLLKRSAVYSATIVSTATSFDRILSLQSGFHIAVAVTMTRPNGLFEQGVQAPDSHEFSLDGFQAIVVTEPIHTETISAPKHADLDSRKTIHSSLQTPLCSP